MVGGSYQATVKGTVLQAFNLVGAHSSHSMSLRKRQQPRVLFPLASSPTMLTQKQPETGQCLPVGVRLVQHNAVGPRSPPDQQTHKESKATQSAHRLGYDSCSTMSMGSSVTMLADMAPYLSTCAGNRNKCKHEQPWLGTCRHVGSMLADMARYLSACQHGQ